MTILGLDFGAGNMKVVGHNVATILPSQVSFASQNIGEADEEGILDATPPLFVRLNGHQYFLGSGAHRWGDPVENLDNSRFVLGSPDLKALVLGSLIDAPRNIDELWVGLPQNVVGKEATENMRQWLQDTHSFWYNRDIREAEQYATVTVKKINCASQATGALFDFVLDEKGQFVGSRQRYLTDEICILSIGMNTLELFVLNNRRPEPRFTTSEPVGIRRLLSLTDPRGLYSRGELDDMLREGTLNYESMIPAWNSEITGVIEDRLGSARNRFGMTVAIGGGVLLLKQQLTTLFKGKIHIPDNPITAVARGLYKYGLLKESRRKK